jgi:flagellar hook-associated protein 2
MSLTTSSVMSAELSQWLQVMMATSTQKIQDVQTQQDQLDVKAGIYTDLRTKLQSLRTALRQFRAVGAASPFAAKTVTGGDETVLSVTPTSSALPANHQVHVMQLARAHTMVSNQVTQTGTDLATAWTGTQSFVIHQAGHDYAVSVTIDSGLSNKDVLSRVSEAINAAAGTAAQAMAIADTPTTARMSLASGATGTANALTFDDSVGFLAALGLTRNSSSTATDGGFIYADQGNNELDAKLTVDGIAIVRGSNTIDDAIADTTLGIKKQQLATDADIAFTVTPDTEAIHGKIQDFLKTFNETYAYMKVKVSVDKTNYSRGALAGESSYIGLWQHLRPLLSGPVASLGSGRNALASIGIKSTDDGTFSISDADALDAALKTDLNGVTQLFAATDGIAQRFDDQLEAYLKGGDGIIVTSKKGLTDQKKMLAQKLTRLETLQSKEKDRLIEQYSALQDLQNLQSSLTTMLSSLSSLWS